MDWGTRSVNKGIKGVNSRNHFCYFLKFDGSNQVNQIKMRSLLLFIVVVLALNGFGQDIIILKNGEEIEAKVTEILSNDVKYKRASNPTGPTYTLPIAKIFMIRYESGDKDVFDGAKQKQEKTDSGNQFAKPVGSSYIPPKKFVYDSEIGDPFCQIKKPVGGMVYGERANEIFYRQDIVFYGFDMTYLKLTNKGKVGDGIVIAPKYMPAWNEVLTNDMLPIRKISDWMGKPSIFISNSVFEYHTHADYQNFVTSVNYCIPFEDLQKIVKAYVLREKEGIGMVINLANFNKEREYSLIYVTFFDIKTRDIMFAAEVSGKAGGSGMTKHWASGVLNAFRVMFIDEIYKPRRTENHMIPSKLRFY